jgi:hypothetical protein
MTQSTAGMSAEQHTVANPDSGEPLLTPAVVVSVVGAVLTLLVAFGLHLSDSQTAAIIGAAAVAAPFVVYAWGRRRAYSPRTVARLLAARGVTPIRDHHRRPA